MGYTNCNPCDPCGTSQSAAKAAAYARQALTSATNAENSWLEFNALYLGAFAVAPTVDNEGDPLQVGALYWNTATNNLWAWNGVGWTVTNNFNEFTTFLATGTTTARNLVTRFADVVNVLDFGADPTGVSDSSVAFQNALDLLNARPNGGMLLIPAGTFKINTQLNYSNNNLSIIGFGKGVSRIIKTVSDPSGNIFNFTTNTLKVLNIKDLQFQVTGNPGNAGTAINGVWPVGLGANTTCVLSNLDFGYSSGSGANNRFSNCIKLRGAAESSITNISSQFVGSSDTTHIRLDCYNNGPAYGILLDHLYLNGGKYGIHQTGWMEMLEIFSGEIVGQEIPIFCDSSASLIPSVPVGRNPVLNIESCHLNGKEWGVKTIQWNAVMLRNLQLYHGVGSGDVNGGNIFITKSKYATVVGCSMGSPLALPIEDTGILFHEVTDFIISSNLFTDNSRQNIGISDSYKGKITSNVFLPSPTMNYCIFIQNVITPGPGAYNKISITDNSFSNANYGIFINANPSDFYVSNNDFDNIILSSILFPSPFLGQEVVVEGNKTFNGFDRILLTDNSTTPSISGAIEGCCNHSNSLPTTITNFTNGYAGQVIDIYANNGNTTIAHGASIKLQGAVNFGMATGNRLFLRKDKNTSGFGDLWYEIGRLT